MIDASIDPVPLGVRSGQTLLVQDGDTVGDHFGAGPGSVVQIEGGTVGQNLEAVDADVLISGGTVGFGLDAFLGTHVQITGGVVESLSAYSQSVVSVLGGNQGFLAAGADSQLNLVGKEFLIDGEPVEGLTVGETVEVTGRSLVLSGILADGSTYNASVSNLTGIRSGRPDIFVDSDATLTLTLIPEPAMAGMMLGGLALLWLLTGRPAQDAD